MASPKQIGLWAAGAFVGVALLASTSSASPGGGGATDVSHKARIWRKLEAIRELDDTQRYFLMLTAYGEGGYNPAAHNGSPSERDASRRAFENNPGIVQRAIDCGVEPAKLQSGSWTTFQLLAPYVSGTVFEIFGDAGCPFADPTRVPSDLNLQIAIAIEHARDLQGYDGFRHYPTVGNLRLGWASPSFMGYISDQAARLTKYRNQAASQRFPAGIVDRTIDRFPSNVAQIYADLRNTPEGP